MDSSSSSQKCSLNRNRKHQHSNAIKLGDVVTFIHDSKKVHGIAEFIDRTDFSSNILCGVALVEKLGKHNGTVKGRCYFKCPDKHGVFVHLRKVSPVQGLFREKIKKRLKSISSLEENKETEEEEGEEKAEKKSEEDMRITVRSFKAPQRLSNTRGCDDKPRPETCYSKKETSLSLLPGRQKMTNHSCSDSGVESPTEHSSIDKIICSTKPQKSTPPLKKNIVVSSFIAESPKKPLIFNSFDEDSGQSELPSSLDDVSKEIPSNRMAVKDSRPSKKALFDDLSAEVFVKEAKNRPNSDKTSNDILPSNSKTRTSTDAKDKIFKKETSALENENDSEDGTSRIPKRVAADPKLSKIKNEEHQDHEKPSQGSPNKSLSTTTLPSKRISRLITPPSSKLRQSSLLLKSTPRKSSVPTSTRKSSVSTPTDSSAILRSSVKSTAMAKKAESGPHKGKKGLSCPFPVFFLNLIFMKLPLFSLKICLLSRVLSRKINEFIFFLIQKDHYKIHPFYVSTDRLISH